jgi:pyruvate carboxylase
VREKAEDGNTGSIGAPMMGGVVNVKVAVGDVVKKGDQLIVLSAMKMETVVAARCGGVVKRVLAAPGDDVKAGDLLVLIE